MVDILNITDKENVLGIKVSGNLSQEDYQTLKPRIDQKIQQQGKINILLDLDDVDAAAVGSMWEELELNAKHSDDVNKIAIVGDQTSENMLAKIKKPMTSAETKFFKSEERDTALQWITKTPSQQ